MSVLIKGIHIPENYIDIRIFADGTAVTSTGEKPYVKIMEVVEVPTPHGRLVDADRMLRDCKYPEVETYTRVALKSAPTVIEAEE